MPERLIEHTPNGREIRYDDQRGIYSVQPANDNYWIETDTLEQARDAYHHPERHR